MTKTILAAAAALIALSIPAFASAPSSPMDAAAIQTAQQTSMPLAQDEEQDQAYPGHEDENNPLAPVEDE